MYRRLVIGCSTLVLAMVGCGSPQANGIDTPIRFLAGDVDRGECELARSVPGHPPVAHTLFDCVDDLGRDTFVNVPLFGCGILGCRHRETYLSRCSGTVQSLPLCTVPFRSSVRFASIIEHQKQPNRKAESIHVQELF